MKKIKTGHKLVSLHGEQLKEGERDVTVGLVVTAVLSAQASDPHRAYQLAKLFATEDTVDLKAEDIVFLKQHLMTSKLGPVYTGQVIELLEASE